MSRLHYFTLQTLVGKNQGAVFITITERIPQTRRKNLRLERTGIEMIKFGKKEIGGDLIFSNLKAWKKGIYGMVEESKCPHFIYYVEIRLQAIAKSDNENVCNLAQSLV